MEKKTLRNICKEVNKKGKGNYLGFPTLEQCYEIYEKNNISTTPVKKVMPGICGGTCLENYCQYSYND